MHSNRIYIAWIAQESVYSEHRTIGPSGGFVVAEVAVVEIYASPNDTVRCFALCQTVRCTDMHRDQASIYTPSGDPLMAFFMSLDHWVSGFL